MKKSKRPFSTNEPGIFVQCSCAGGVSRDIRVHERWCKVRAVLVMEGQMPPQDPDDDLAVRYEACRTKALQLAGAMAEIAELADAEAGRVLGDMADRLKAISVTARSFA